MTMTLVADPAAVRARYGKSYATASEPQRANRDADMFDGGGRYRRRRRMRRGGLSRMYRKYRGRGLYGGSGGFFSDLWDKTRGHLGAAFKEVAPKWAGNALSGLETFGKAQGWGGYDTGEPATVNNDIVDGGAGLNVPQFESGGGEMGTICISHREYVADVFGPETAGTFQNLTYGLNPALPGTFPWLSQVAANYEEYTIKQLIFTFRTTVTDFVASNGQVGTILMATQYNANDAPFQSKQDMMEYAGAVSAKVSQQVHAGVECDPAQLSGSAGKYTRSGPVPPGEDIKTYDLGTLNVATSNTPAGFNNQAVGELWVSYTVELRKPKFFVTRAQQLLTDVFQGNIAVADNINQVPWAVGQQNRIGGQLCTEFGALYPPAVNRLYYVFPATFSGNVEVAMTASLDAADAFIYLGAQGAPPATTAPPGIVPIADMWAQNQWNSQIVAARSTTDVNSSYKAHFKIVSPTTAATAVDNVLTILCSGLATDYRITVTMYNTGMNYARVDRPILANPSTDQVIEFPNNVGFFP